MQDRFKQTIIISDEHFDWMSVYVNCNYEIHGLGDAREYEWSSYQDYLGLCNGTLCNKPKIKMRFKIVKKYKEFCNRVIAEFQEKKIWEKMRSSGRDPALAGARTRA